MGYHFTRARSFHTAAADRDTCTTTSCAGDRCERAPSRMASAGSRCAAHAPAECSSDLSPRAFDTLETAVSPDVTISSACGECPARSHELARGQSSSRMLGSPLRAEVFHGVPMPCRSASAEAIPEHGAVSDSLSNIRDEPHTVGGASAQTRNYGAGTTELNLSRAGCTDSVEDVSGPRAAHSAPQCSCAIASRRAFKLRWLRAGPRGSRHALVLASQNDTSGSRIERDPVRERRECGGTSPERIERIHENADLIEARPEIITWKRGEASRRAA